MNTTTFQGVSLAYLISLGFDEDKDVNDICRVVLEITLDSKSSLVDKLSNNANTQKFVASKADMFISYAWKMLWGPLKRAILSASKTQDVYIWMDVFMVNQHLAGQGIV